MDSNELAERLAAEGCSPDLYSIGRGGSDVFCLAHERGSWRVFYTERGNDSPPIFKSSNEDEACQFFYRHITGMRHDHCVGFFRSERQALALAQRLETESLSTWHDRIPYGGVNDPRYRVFVAGKAIFRAIELLGALPVRD